MAYQYRDGPARDVSRSKLTPASAHFRYQSKLISKMLKHAGMLEAQASLLTNFDNTATDVKPVWREWQRREHNHR
jgi:hypothetical protein